MIVPEPIERYAEEHTSPPEQLLVELEAETKATLTYPQMMAGAVQGRFLEFLVYSLERSPRARDRHVQWLRGAVHGGGSAARRPHRHLRDRRAARGGRSPLHRAQPATPIESPSTWARRSRRSRNSKAASTSSSSTPTKRATSTTTRPFCPGSPSVVSSPPTTRCPVDARSTAPGPRSSPSTSTSAVTNGLSACCFRSATASRSSAVVHEARRVARLPCGAPGAPAATAARRARARSAHRRSATRPQRGRRRGRSGTDGGFFVAKTIGRYSSGMTPVRRAWTSSTASHQGRKRTGAGVSAGGSGARGRSSSSRPALVAEAAEAQPLERGGEQCEPGRRTRRRRLRALPARSRGDTSGRDDRGRRLPTPHAARPTAPRARIRPHAAAPTSLTAGRERSPSQSPARVFATSRSSLARRGPPASALRSNSSLRRASRDRSSCRLGPATPEAPAAGPTEKRQYSRAETSMDRRCA